MSITYSGIEWDYNNLDGIAYDSETLLEPYATWFYQITGALNYEKEYIELNLTDSSNYDSIYKHKDNIIKIKDSSIRLVNYIENESLSLSENYYRDLKKILSEEITLSSSEDTHDVTKELKEDSLYVLDECRYIKTQDGESIVVEQEELSGNISLFDFELNSSVWSESDFDDWCNSNAPINYQELRPFIPGEYEYKDAYAGFRLSRPPSSGRFGVANSTVYVDVEDTVEKGTVQASSGELTQVNFSKRFYTSPQIMTSLLYTTENCYVEVSEVTAEYFKFGLKSTSTGNYIAGEINWLADGY